MWRAKTSNDFFKEKKRTHRVASLRAGPEGRISYNLYFDCKLVRHVTCDLINEYTSRLKLFYKTETLYYLLSSLAPPSNPAPGAVRSSRSPYSYTPLYNLTGSPLCLNCSMCILGTGASFQLFLGGRQIFFKFFNAIGLLKNWKKALYM